MSDEKKTKTKEVKPIINTNSKRITLGAEVSKPKNKGNKK